MMVISLLLSSSESRLQWHREKISLQDKGLRILYSLLVCLVICIENLGREVFVLLCIQIAFLLLFRGVGRISNLALVGSL